MELIVDNTDITITEPIVMMNRDDCLQLGLSAEDRVIITGKSRIVSKIMISDSDVRKGVILMPTNIMNRCGSSKGDAVNVAYSPVPESISSIRKKINGGRLSNEEIDSIVEDIQKGNLSKIEIIAFVSSFGINNSSLSEIAALTESMASTGDSIDFGYDRVFDFHSLGGVPGNKITPIVVSILASEGITIPKMSSRAISSACGTADFVETFCDIEFDSDELKRIVSETNGAFVCGNDNYAPVGSLIIDAERPMGIDPRPMMMASIMSKKTAIGVTHLLIDIPAGKGAKISDLDTAKDYAGSFIGLGKELGIHIECVVTRADQPIGRSIGPILEAKECIEALENRNGHPALIEKACGTAGIILEMKGSKNGKERAEEILRSGKAHEKFLQIVGMQNGDPALRSIDLVPGRFTKDIHAKRSGYVQFIDNSGMVAIAKGAGSPNDRGAGVSIAHDIGDHVNEGDVLFTIYAENDTKLSRAIESARSRMPIFVSEGSRPEERRDMIIEHISE